MNISHNSSCIEAPFIFVMFLLCTIRREINGVLLRDKLTLQYM